MTEASSKKTDIPLTGVWIFLFKAVLLLVPMTLPWFVWVTHSVVQLHEWRAGHSIEGRIWTDRIVRLENRLDNLFGTEREKGTDR